MMLPLRMLTFVILCPLRRFLTLRFVLMCTIIPVVMSFIRGSVLRFLRVMVVPLIPLLSVPFAMLLIPVVCPLLSQFVFGWPSSLSIRGCVSVGSVLPWFRGMPVRSVLVILFVMMRFGVIGRFAIIFMLWVIVGLLRLVSPFGRLLMRRLRVGLSCR